MIPQIGGVICSTNYDTYVRKLRYCHYCDEKLTEYKFKLIAKVIKIILLVKVVIFNYGKFWHENS